MGVMGILIGTAMGVFATISPPRHPPTTPPLFQFCREQIEVLSKKGSSISDLRDHWAAYRFRKKVDTALSAKTNAADRAQLLTEIEKEMTDFSPWETPSSANSHLREAKREYLGMMATEKEISRWLEIFENAAWQRDNLKLSQSLRLLQNVRRSASIPKILVTVEQTFRFLLLDGMSLELARDFRNAFLKLSERMISDLEFEFHTAGSIAKFPNALLTINHTLSGFTSQEAIAFQRALQLNRIVYDSAWDSALTSKDRPTRHLAYWIFSQYADALEAEFLESLRQMGRWKLILRDYKRELISHQAPVLATEDSTELPQPQSFDYQLRRERSQRWRDKLTRIIAEARFQKLGRQMEKCPLGASEVLGRETFLWIDRLIARLGGQNLWFMRIEFAKEYIKLRSREKI